MKIKLMIIVMALVFQNSLIGQSKKEPKDSTLPKKGELFITPVPVLGANPAFGFIYGFGAGVSAYFGKPENTSISSFLMGCSYTTKNQLIVTLKSTAYTNNNKWVLVSDWRYLDSSQPTYGLGTGPQSARLANNGFEFDDVHYNGISESDMMTYKFFRFHQTAFLNLNNNGFFVGVGIHADVFTDIHDQLLQITNNDTVITPYYAYNISNGFSQDDSKLIGFSANLLIDKRDNINSTYKGQYAMVSFKYNPTFLGSNQKSTTFWLEYRNYYSLDPKHNNILAFWAFGNFTTSGKLPYLNLPSTAWDLYSKSGAPYAQGRFRGPHMVFATTEFRKTIWGTSKNSKLIRAVAFVNFTTASGDENGIKLFNYLEPGYGVGLRVNVSKKARTCLGIDYGWGHYGTTGVFLRLNENF